MGKKSTTRLGDGAGTPVTQHTYPPNGSDKALQNVISHLLHQITIDEGTATLAEMGYLHINTLTYNRETGAINLKIYFDARLATRTTENVFNQEKARGPIRDLEVFRNYLYVGTIFSVVTYEEIMAPKGKIEPDACGYNALRFKDDGKMVATPALVINCSLPLTIAAAHDINLLDPEFKISCTTVGKSGKDPMRSIITTASSAEVPVSLTVTASAGDEYVGYNPDYAEIYLKSLATKLAHASENREKLSDKVRSDAKKAKKKSKNKQPKGSKNFDKYS